MHKKIASYVSSPTDLNSLRTSCRVAYKHINYWLLKKLLQSFPELQMLLPQRFLILLSLHFREALAKIKSNGFISNGAVTESELTLLLLWQHVQPNSIYLSTQLWRKLEHIFPRAFEKPFETSPGIIYAASSTLKRHLLVDATVRGASRVVHFICNGQDSSELLDALFSNLLLHVRYELAVRSFSESIKLLLPLIKDNLEWLQLCNVKGNLALFDALIAGFVIENDLILPVTRLYCELLLTICKSNLHSRALLKRPEIPDTLIPQAMLLCLQRSNWRMATEILRHRHPSSLVPTISFATAQALRFMILEDDERFTAESFHERFGVQADLLQVVAELGFPDFFVMNRFEVLLLSGHYQINRNSKIASKYDKFIRHSICAIN